MKYYSEETVKGLLEQMDSHFVKYLENLPSIEVKEPHGDLIERDKLPQNHITDHNLEGHSVVDLEDVQNAPIILEASTSTDRFCNTERCSNSKPDMSKAQNHICPYYQGVCSLDENILCYCQHHYEICEKFLKVGKEIKK